MFRLRPSSRDDTGDVLRVLSACDVRDFGVADFTRDLLVSQWRVGEFDPAADAVAAEDHRTIVGYAGLFSGGALAFVDPEREGEGVGSYLLGWTEARARERGRECHRQRVAGRNAGGHALLVSAGYREVRSVLRMVRTVRAPRVVPPAPHGITLHPLDAGADAAALYAADAAAFAGNPDYNPVTFGEFHDEHIATPDLDPTLSAVARRDDTVVGFTLCKRLDSGIGYVDLLAVEEIERGRGLGTVLLLTAFAAFTNAQLHEAQLDVASDNPRALRLYTRAGMTPRHRVHVFEKPAP